MINMKNQLPTNSVILVNPNDAGGFIPAVASYKVAYLFSGSRSSISYITLCDLILSGNLNHTTFDLMNNLNITHIFVGSTALSHDGVRDLGNQRWNPILFLGNPNFNLVQKVNNSYLFAYTPISRNTLFFDDFENPDIQYNGWQMQMFIEGNGTAKTSLSLDPLGRFDGNSSLALTAKNSPNSLAITWFYRMFYLPIQVITQQ